MQLYLIHFYNADFEGDLISISELCQKLFHLS